MPEARVGGWEERPHVQEAVAAQVQEGLEELFHIQGGGVVLRRGRPDLGPLPQTVVVASTCFL